MRKSRQNRKSKPRRSRKSKSRRSRKSRKLRSKSNKSDIVLKILKKYYGMWHGDFVHDIDMELKKKKILFIGNFYDKKYQKLILDAANEKISKDDFANKMLKLMKPHNIKNF